MEKEVLEVVVQTIWDTAVLKARLLKKVEPSEREVEYFVEWLASLLSP